MTISVMVALPGDTQPSLFLEHFTVNNNSCSSKVVLIAEWAFVAFGEHGAVFYFLKSVSFSGVVL